MLFSLKMFLICWVSLCSVLWKLLTFELAMCPIYLSRGAISSFMNVPRTKELLSTNPYFKWLLDTMYSHFFVRHFWVLANKSGSHPYHFDKFLALFRLIISLGCYGKMMWFKDKDTGASFGLSIPHGAVVVLSRFGGGITSNIVHCIRDGNNSWIIVFELDFKN